MQKLTKDVEEYWDSHHLGTQFFSEAAAAPGSKEYFLGFDRAMERWEYKNRLINWIATEYPRGKLLEVGCGLGQDLTKFARRGLSVTGIDLAPSVAEMAQRHLEAYNLEGQALQGNAERLDFQYAGFDVVHSCGVLQHTPDIQQAVNEIYRVTREGGLAVVVVYYRYSWFNLVSKFGRANIEFEDQDPPIINKYSKRELRKIFSSFSKVDITLEYCYPSPTPRKGPLAALYNRGFIPALKTIPYAVMKNFGWHVVVKAQKQTARRSSVDSSAEAVTHSCCLRGGQS
jgi:ubiquinone/menaquinone biosynthesis C-methylase UbiE